MSLKFIWELCVMTMKSDAKLKRNWLVSSKLIWGIWQILTWALRNLKKLHFNGLLLTKAYHVWAKKYRGVMFDGTEYWCKIWRKTYLCCLKWHEEFWLKNSDFILESKIAELNQNKNWKEPDRPDAVWKLYFALEVN